MLRRNVGTCRVQRRPDPGETVVSNCRTGANYTDAYRGSHGLDERGPILLRVLQQRCAAHKPHWRLEGALPREARHQESSFR